MSSTIAFPRQGIPLRADRNALARDWTASFVRAATSNVLGRIQGRSPAAILSESWPDDNRAALVQRGAVETLKQSALPGESVTRLMLLAPRSAAVQLFEFATKVDLSGVSSFSFPLPTSFSQAVFVEEGKAIPVAMGSFTGTPIGPVKKIALMAGLTNELESASADIASVIIEHTLRVAVGNGLDAVLFDNVAGDDVRPPGLLYGVTPITPTTGGGFPAMNADLRALVAEISAAGLDTASVVFVAAAEQAISLMLQAGPHFSYRVISANLTPGTVIAIATAGLVAAGEGVPVVDASKHATAHFSDTPSHIGTAGTPPTVAAPTLSSFQLDAFILRCIARITWSIAPGAAQVVTGASW